MWPTKDCSFQPCQDIEHPSKKKLRFSSEQSQSFPNKYSSSSAVGKLVVRSPTGIKQIFLFNCFISFVFVQASEKNV